MRLIKSKKIWTVKINLAKSLGGILSCTFRDCTHAYVKREFRNTWQKMLVTFGQKPDDVDTHTQQLQLITSALTCAFSDCRGSAFVWSVRFKIECASLTQNTFWVFGHFKKCFEWIIFFNSHQPSLNGWRNDLSAVWSVPKACIKVFWAFR